jgi:hypothetical protein
VPNDITTTCCAASSTNTGMALPASSSPARAGVARSRSQVRQARSAMIAPPTTDRASSENSTSMPVTTCEVPASTP